MNLGETIDHLLKSHPFFVLHHTNDYAYAHLHWCNITFHNGEIIYCDKYVWEARITQNAQRVNVRYAMIAKYAISQRNSLRQMHNGLARLLTASEWVCDDAYTQSTEVNGALIDVPEFLRLHVNRARKTSEDIPGLTPDEKEQQDAERDYWRQHADDELIDFARKQGWLGLSASVLRRVSITFYEEIASRSVYSTICKTRMVVKPVRQACFPQQEYPADSPNPTSRLAT